MMRCTALVSGLPRHCRLMPQKGGSTRFAEKAKIVIHRPLTTRQTSTTSSQSSWSSSITNKMMLSSTFTSMRIRGFLMRSSISSGLVRTTTRSNNNLRRGFSSALAKRNAPRQNHNNNNSPPRIPAYIWIFAGSSTAIIGYCYYSGLDSVPMTNRTRWLATNIAWEQRLGHQEYANLLRQFQGQILPPTHRASVTVQRVGRRLAQATQEFYQRYPPASSRQGDEYMKQIVQQPYTYTVVRSDMANAFVLPGNHVFVLTGLFQYVHNEDDLAAVLGHEMAHNLSRHAGERVSSQFLMQLLAQITLALDSSGALLALVLPATQLLRELPHSRCHETEADQMGLTLAALACFDPRAAPRVFANMMDEHAITADDSAVASRRREPPEFLSTHPSHEHRIQNFEDWMPQALQIFENHGDCAAVRRDVEAARQAAARQAEQREGRKVRQ